MIDPMTFWSALPADIQSYLIKTAAGLTVQLLGGRKGKKVVAKALNEAYLEGIKGFCSTFGEHIAHYKMKDFVGDNELRSFFVQIAVTPPTQAQYQLIEQKIEAVGIETASITGFNIKESVQRFIDGFMGYAEASDILLPYLQAKRAEQSVELQQQLNLLVAAIRDQLAGEPVDPDFLREKYFGYLRNKYAMLSLKGLTDKELLPLSLKRIYTKVTFSRNESGTHERLVATKKGVSPPDEGCAATEAKTADFKDIMKSQYAVITGEPGAGKSTLMKYIALACAEGQAKERLGVRNHLMPVIFPISAFAEACRENGARGYSLKRFFQDYFEGKGLPDLVPLFTKAGQEGKAVFLIDGLDEVADEQERLKVIEDIRNLVMDTDFSDNIFIITCRIESYQRASRFEPIAGKDFAHFTIQEFADDQIIHFLKNWFEWLEREHYQRGTIEEAHAKAVELFDTVKEDDNILALARSPLMLTILVLIEHEGGELPKTRAELYARCLTILAGSWEKVRSLHEGKKTDFTFKNRPITDETIVSFLGPVAWEMQAKTEKEIAFHDLKALLAKEFDSRNKEMALSREQADDFIAIMKEKSGLLQEVATGSYGFIHQTFREYLAARVLTDLRSGGERINTLGEKLFQPEWREVVLLTAATLRKAEAGEFVRNIMARTGTDYQNLLLAGECVHDISRDKIPDQVYDDLMNALHGVQRGDEPAKVRAPVAEIASWISEEGITMEDEFVEVEGGEYNLDGLGTVQLESFELHRYPVTNRWFEEFVTAGGYAKPEWWTPTGRKWLEHAEQKEPRLWRDPKWRCPEAPVVGVSWFEAVAFCLWLTEIRDDGFVYHLPTEQQWQAVAAGKKGREYPWGDTGGEGICNSEEAEIKKTSVITLFPQGVTPENGIVDLCGNVWEWCRTRHKDQATQEDFPFYKEWKTYWTKKELAVLRGGSWFSVHNWARCASRGGNFPSLRVNHIGFRCARTKK